jgi:multidrug resistance efflux pump
MAMDKPRANPRKKRGPLYIGIAVVAAALITLGLSRLKPAPPSVDRAAQIIDTVKRGPMVKQVRGPGTLVPEQIRIIPAVTSGRVVEVLARPGTIVEPGTPLLRMDNPDVMLQLLDAQRQLTSARSELVTMTASLEQQRLTQEGAVAALQTQYNDAVRQDKVNEELNQKGLIEPNRYAQAKDLLKELSERLDLEKRRLKLQVGSVDEQLDAQKKQVDRLMQIVAFREEQLESMNVNAGSNGVLQRLDLEIGQWVNSGTELARVVQPEKLKAVLRIPETQAVEVVLGQTAEIDTRNGIVSGTVVRIDPASQGGTVGVDIALPDELPAGARPDLSVDGRIEIARLADVLHMGRPPFGNAESTIGVFKLEPDGKTAVRVSVKLGVASVNEIEVKSGLSQGDAVILSDMSAWDAYDRVRLR